MKKSPPSFIARHSDSIPPGKDFGLFDPEVAKGIREGAFGKKTYVLREHRKKTTHEKRRDELWRMFVGFKLLREVRDVPSNLARDFRGVLGGVKLVRSNEELPKNIRVLREVLDEETVTIKRLGKVGSPRLPSNAA